MVQIPDASALGAWRKSSYCGGDNADCVEIADGFPFVPVRDGKDPSGPALTFTTEAWAFRGALPFLDPRVGQRTLQPSRYPRKTPTPPS
jgi:hypothetical protein